MHAVSNILGQEHTAFRQDRKLWASELAMLAGGS